ITDADAQLRPYRLTAELESLFRSFDGWIVSDGDCALLPLAECVRLRREMLDTLAGYWSRPPLALLPFFQLGNIQLFTVLGKQQAPGGIVISICIPDGDSHFIEQHASVADFMGAIIADRGIALREDGNRYPCNALPASWC